MKVLLSVKPQFAQSIFNGSKEYEYRKVIFNKQGIKKVMVYASNPIKNVIGEFEIEEIIFDEIDRLWAKTESKAGISRECFLKYFSNKSKGYAIKIKDSKAYDVPLTLGSLMITTPPQSFRYV